MNLKEKNISCLDCGVNGKDIIRREKDLFFNYEDVKEAVLEFENLLKRAINDHCKSVSTQDVLDMHKYYFGDFEK